VDFFHEEVRPRLSVETVYSAVKFTSRRERYWRGPCPLHGGKDPNFSVDTETLGWTCFSRCGTGDVVAFVAGGPSPRDQDFVEAVRKLADMVGVDASALDRPPTPEEEDLRRKGDLLQTFLSHAQADLLGDSGKPVRDYLVGRGFKEDKLEDLGLGLYSTKAEVKDRLVKAGFTADEVETSKLLWDPRWTSRLVIPWRDYRGTLRNFAARPITDEEPKYLYLKDAPKAELVAFGLDMALRQDAGGRKLLVLVEGLMDVLSLQARGFRNVAAIGGRGNELSTERWKDLGRLGVQNAVLVLDNDPKADPCTVHERVYCVPCSPGQDGTRTAVQNVHKGRNVPKVYVVDPEDLYEAAGRPTKDSGPVKVDPDELVRDKGLEAFRAVLNKRQAGAVFLGNALLEDVTPESPDHEKREAVERVERYIREDLRGKWARVEADEILQAVAERTGWNADSLKPIFKAAEEAGQKEAMERELARALREAQAAREEGKDASEVAQKLRTELVALEARTLDEPEPFSVDRLHRLSQELPEGKLSGWKTLDEKLGLRFNAQELAYVGARTGHAKTSFLVGLLMNWLEAAEAEGRDEVLVFYSHEEPEVRVFHRLLALLSTQAPGDGWKPWSANRILNYLGDPNFDPECSSPEALKAAQARLRELEDRLLVVNRPGWDADRIVAHAHSLAEKRTVGAVLVDYLQRITPPRETMTELPYRQIAAIGRRFKSLAVDLSVPVVVGAQINREAGKGKKVAEGCYEDKNVQKSIRALRPQLHHLREGGSEQEADLVLGLLNYRADFETDEEGEHKEETKTPDVTRLEVGVLKNRYGEVGRWASLAFEGRYHLLRDPNYDVEV